jgi:hypothetical protein
MAKRYWYFPPVREKAEIPICIATSLYLVQTKQATRQKRFF